MSRIPESGVPSSSGILDFTTLEQLFIVVREAKRDVDVGPMANIFIKSFADDKTAQLLYHRDRIWFVVVEMLRTYLDDDYTHVMVAWDAYSDTIVGWTSVSLVTSDQADYFAFCDSTVWAGRQLLRRDIRNRRGAPLHLDEMRRASLITKLQQQNREGQNRHASADGQGQGQHLVINTIAIHPEVVEGEIPEIAYKLLDEARDLAKREGLPLYAQVPQNSLGNLETLFEEIGFAEVGNFELNLNRYASEAQSRWRNWGFQAWTQWVLRTGNWERGRRYMSYRTVDA